MYQPSHITPPEQINDELLEQQAFLETPCATDNGSLVMQRLDTLAGYMARSGKLKADAEWHYNKLVDSEIMKCLAEMIQEKLSASTINKMIEAKAKDYKFLLTWAERVNRSATHQIDSYRSIISNIKAEKFSNGRF